MNAIGASYDLPPDKQGVLRRAKRVEKAAIAFLLSIVLLIAIVMGASQTMKALWVEDTLSLVPSISFLIGARYREKDPDEAYPYGYRRAVLVGFMFGAFALFGFGIYILGDSLLSLINAEHPGIQTIQLFGRNIWLGWLMLAALVYSVIPPWILGRMKMRLAGELHDKVLHVSATLDKGDWLSGLAGAAGILGIAFGWWWMDGAAAAFISFEIIDDGWANLRNAIAQLMDKRPSDIESQQPDPVIDKLQDTLRHLPWVKDAKVRLREQGDLLIGEAFVVPRDDRDLISRLEQAAKVAGTVDWRLHDINIVPVRSAD